MSWMPIKGLLILMLVPGVASALDLKTSITTTINKLATTVKIVKPEPPSLLPENCREEKVKSAGPVDWKTAFKDCKRYVCGPYFWNESAVDICPTKEVVKKGQKPNQAVYKVMKVRHPKREFSNDPWTELPVQASGPEFLCGTYRPGPNISNQSSLAPFLLSEAYANIVPRDWSPCPEGTTGHEPENQRPWTDGEKQMILEALEAAQARILDALNRGDASLTGLRDSELRAYIYMTLESTAWLLHELSSSRFACPPHLKQLCDMVSPLEMKWTDFGCTAMSRGERTDCLAGETNSLEWILTDKYFSLEDNPAFLGYIAPTVVHEATHIINHFLDAWRANGYNRNTLDFSGDWTDPELIYTDETTARIVEGLLYTFLNAAEQSAVPSNMQPHSDYARSTIVGLVAAGKGNLARSRMLGPSYVAQILLSMLDESDRRWTMMRESGVTATLNSAFYGCDPEIAPVGRRLAEAWGGIREFFGEMENRFGQRGGVMELAAPLFEGSFPEHMGLGTGVLDGLPAPSLNRDLQTSPFASGTGLVTGASPLPNPSASYPSRSGNSSDAIGGEADDPNFYGVPAGREDRSYSQMLAALEKGAAEEAASSGTSSGAGTGGTSGSSGTGGISGGSGGSATAGTETAMVAGVLDTDGDGMTNDVDPDDDCKLNDASCEGDALDNADLDDDNDGINDDEDYSPDALDAPTGFSPEAGNRECVMADANGTETCYSVCQCDANNPWWCRPVWGSTSSYPCPADSWNVPNGESRRSCVYSWQPYEEWSGNTLRCGRRGYCGGQWVWTLEDGSCSGEMQYYEDYLEQPDSGCSYYYGPIACYTGSEVIPERCWTDGTNQACKNNGYCGCTSEPGGVFQGCCEALFVDADYEDEWGTYWCEWMAGGNCYCFWIDYCIGGG